MISLFGEILIVSTLSVVAVNLLCYINIGTEPDTKDINNLHINHKL